MSNIPAEAIRLGTETAEAMNIDGWITVADPSTGEPVQERLPADHIVEGIITAALPALDAPLVGPPSGIDPSGDRGNDLVSIGMHRDVFHRVMALLGNDFAALKTNEANAEELEGWSLVPAPDTIARQRFNDLDADGRTPEQAATHKVLMDAAGARAANLAKRAAAGETTDLG